VFVTSVLVLRRAQRFLINAGHYNKGGRARRDTAKMSWT
jgi:hypothetical protein